MSLCIEKKLTLSGTTQTFSCELLHFEERFGVLRYVIDREYAIGGITLLPGDVTTAFFWEDRPYTLYTWGLGKGKDDLFYFNIADSVRLAREEFFWRDLVVDILIDRQGAAHVLDEHELPQDLDQGLAGYIQRAKDEILGRYSDIMAEAWAWRSGRGST